MRFLEHLPVLTDGPDGAREPINGLKVDLNFPKAEAVAAGREPGMEV